MTIIAPSLLAADFLNLNADIQRVTRAQWLHYDVMDGHFVPNISMGADILSLVRKAAPDKFLDVHLMISEPVRYAEAFKKAGADCITFHYEAAKDVKGTVNAIKSLGIQVGISIKPQTRASEILPFVDCIDMALVMSVEPGFGGQCFMESALPKIAEIRAAANIKNQSLKIEVDGGINSDTARLCADAGADVLVAGSALFKSENPDEFIKSLAAL